MAQRACQKRPMSFYNYSRRELGELLKTRGFERFRADQLTRHVYQQRLAAANRQFLPARLGQLLDGDVLSTTLPATIVSTRISKMDGTRKWLLALGQPDAKVEMVLIPDETRRTLCVSSQAGCSLSCTFCHTGTQKLTRNLRTEEIVTQYLLARHEVPDITNVVFMGQGEPLYNWHSVSRAVQILTDPLGLAMGRGKITVSTSGIAPAIPRIAQELGVQLAVSLHASNDALRTRIMPINRTYPLRTLLDACEEFCKLSSCANRRITFEYVMLDGVNDSIEKDARPLISLLSGLPAHINLIPFNRWPGTTYQPSPRSRITEFDAYLNARGLPSTIRWPRGQDIFAACGQLKSAIEQSTAMPTE